MLIDHRLAGEAGAAKGVTQRLGEGGEDHRAALGLARLGGRQQKLDRGDVGLVDVRAVDLEPLLAAERLANEIIDTANGRYAAIGGQPQRPLRLRRIERHRCSASAKFRYTFDVNQMSKL